MKKVFVLISKPQILFFLKNRYSFLNDEVLFVCFCLFKANFTTSLQAVGLDSYEKSMNNFEVLHDQS